MDGNPPEAHFGCGFDALVSVGGLWYPNAPMFGQLNDCKSLVMQIVQCDYTVGNKQQVYPDYIKDMTYRQAHIGIINAPRQLALLV
ncbi:hypothetical protein C5167_022517 [Papaver somniferum]|uniref:Uncharacterized protein n=1 Tax=Papaver somniferum TaxID=3469 RepID=A0A4Y7JL50_PAPSO|nr:hypothetical protein C5167_022517 [Papaver somniferum]